MKGHVVKIKFNFKPRGDLKKKREFISNWAHKSSTNDSKHMSQSHTSDNDVKMMSHTYDIPKVMSPTTTSNTSRRKHIDKKFLEYYSWVRGDKIYSLKLKSREINVNNNHWARK